MESIHVAANGTLYDWSSHGGSVSKHARVGIQDSILGQEILKERKSDNPAPWLAQENFRMDEAWQAKKEFGRNS